MKKKFWTARLKTILIIALVVAICAAVTLAIATGTSVLENVVGTILSPVRAGVASIDRLAQRYYDYMFRYASLEAENAEMEKQILALSFTNGLTQTEVAKEIGISQAQVSRLEKGALDKIKSHRKITD